MVSTIFRFVLFLLTIIIPVFWSHYLLYFTAVSFFGIVDTYIKWIIAIWLFIFSISFIVASVLAHWKDTLFTRGLYVVAAAWLGFLTYLVISCAIAWGIYFLGAYFQFEISTLILWIVTITAALLVGMYGLWNATHIRVTEVQVPIVWLDPEWEGKKIVQISDVHLGHVLRQDFLWDIVDKINNINPEFVCITWDFFDGMDGNLEHLSEPLNGIAAPRGVYYVDGNHEAYLGTERSLEAIGETKTHILRDQIVSFPGLQLIGISFLGGKGLTEKQNVLEVAHSLPDFKPEVPYVLLYHKPFLLPTTNNSDSGLILFGHTHKGQLFPFTLIVKVIFGPLSYGLSQFGNLSVYVSSGVGTWGPPMRVGTIPEIVSIELVRAK